jgi:hypothetical protein
MVILIPSFNRYATVAGICRQLLGRYWPDPPPVNEVAMAGSTWLGEVVDAVKSIRDELFLLMLDDYALCSRAKTDKIAGAAAAMERDPQIGFFPLCWYPARGRVAEPSQSEIVRLLGAPVLLQAAIWRRQWFLDLANNIDPRASAWGFEAAATQKLRTAPHFKICAFDHPEPPWLGGAFIDGFDKRDWPLPYHNLMHRGRPAPEHESFLREHGFSFPSQGAGDSIAKLAEAVGIAQVVRKVENVMGRSCGCSDRRQWLNKKLPYE